jgi:hypothetical protein
MSDEAAEIVSLGVALQETMDLLGAAEGPEAVAKRGSYWQKGRIPIEGRSVPCIRIGMDKHAFELTVGAMIALGNLFNSTDELGTVKNPSPEVDRRIFMQDGAVTIFIIGKGERGGEGLLELEKTLREHGIPRRPLIAEQTQGLLGRR